MTPLSSAAARRGVFRNEMLNAKIPPRVEPRETKRGQARALQIFSPPQFRDQFVDFIREDLPVGGGGAGSADDVVPVRRGHFAGGPCATLR